MLKLFVNAILFLVTIVIIIEYWDDLFKLLIDIFRDI